MACVLGTLAISVLVLLCVFLYSERAECFPACHPQNGFCEDDNVCRCQPGWQGPLCDQCVTFPGCVNGLCVEPWQCICDDGWDGNLCDIDVRACASTPCAHNGTCVNLDSGHYECSCAPGFSGKDCQKKDGPCVINGDPFFPGFWHLSDDKGSARLKALTLNAAVLVLSKQLRSARCTWVNGPLLNSRAQTPAGPPEHRILKVSMKELNKGTPLLSEGQAVCFTVLGVLTSLVVLGTVGIVFLHKCEAWLSHLRYHRVLRRKNSLLLHCNSGEDLHPLPREARHGHLQQGGRRRRHLSRVPAGPSLFSGPRSAHYMRSVLLFVVEFALFCVESGERSAYLYYLCVAV
uniref:EGF-like domain-containing protein n=1 Tax=Ursus maritimus TaxID=29073 RepID=A0A452SXW1_URSMA